MPSSHPEVIQHILPFIQKANPASVLDIGIGYGKWAFLIREYCEAWKNRVHMNSWKVKIDGVEVWAPYVNLPWIKCLYNDVYNAKIENIIHSLPNYEMIIAGDVLEHLAKEDSVKVVKHIFEKASKCVLISLPVGQAWMDNMIIDGNAYEKHQCCWEPGELLLYVNESVWELHALRLIGGISAKVIHIYIFKKKDMCHINLIA